MQEFSFPRSPPWPRRGGRTIKKMVPFLLKRGRGGLISTTRLRGLSGFATFSLPLLRGFHAHLFGGESPFVCQFGYPFIRWTIAMRGLRLDANQNGTAAGLRDLHGCREFE